MKGRPRMKSRRRQFARVECVECGEMVKMSTSGALVRHLSDNASGKCEGSGHFPHLRGWKPASVCAEIPVKIIDARLKSVRGITRRIARRRSAA